MGFVLSLLYLVVSYLTPPTVFGSLAQYRIELVLAVLILLVSIPRLMRSFVLKTPQALALAGLSLAVFLSILVALHWTSGAVDALLGFIPSIYAYFLLGLHCNSRKKLQSLVLMLLFVCLFVIANGVRDLRTLNALTGSRVAASSVNTEDSTWEFEHPYTFPMMNNSGEWLFRIRGLGGIHDPNDFGQLLVCEIPLLFIFWRAKKRIRNFVFVLLPACILVYGIYLTHSRGALVALAVVILVAARRRIGTVPAVVIAGALFAGAMALHFTGGRAISASAGEDRTELWGESLQLLKSHPVFGVGFGQLPDYLGHTAHNSVVVCVTELGLFGLFFWSLFLFPTLRNVFLLSSPKRVETIEDAPDEMEANEFPLLSRPWKGTALDKPEINHWGYCLLLSLIGFLAAGWFLSRAFVMTLFLLGGMVEVLYETAQRRGMTAPRLALGRIFVYSSWLMVGSVTAVYIMLRILNLSR
ncbi:MAG: O-antigen ligase family protein [Terracidiphilus sp.]